MIEWISYKRDENRRDSLIYIAALLSLFSHHQLSMYPHSNLKLQLYFADLRGPNKSVYKTNIVLTGKLNFDLLVHLDLPED